MGGWLHRCWSYENHNALQCLPFCLQFRGAAALCQVPRVATCLIKEKFTGCNGQWMGNRLIAKEKFCKGKMPMGNILPDPTLRGNCDQIKKKLRTSCGCWSGSGQWAMGPIAGVNFELSSCCLPSGHHLSSSSLKCLTVSQIGQNHPKCPGPGVQPGLLPN